MEIANDQHASSTNHAAASNSLNEDIIVATAMAPSNLACIKYWGKRDSGDLNLPLNSSLSVTLDVQDQINTVTSIACFVGEKYANSGLKDRLFLNGAEEVDACYKKGRLRVVLSLMRSLVKSKFPGEVGEKLSKAPVMIVSKNSFPTAAGLASSAAGYACLVTALAGVFGILSKSPSGAAKRLDTDDMLLFEELSRIARQGSGSASRSLHGGFVQWNMGEKADGSDSVAIQVAPRSHWPELEALICVVSDRKKSTSSTGGMTDSVRTSELLIHRAKNIVPKRLEAIRKAILEKDFGAFAEITMKDSNQFHATCLDTYPPIFYLNDISRTIIGIVHDLNSTARTDDVEKGKVVETKPPRYAYTFDAGPNAVIFTLKKDIPELLEALLRHFHPNPKDTRVEPDFAFVRGRTQMTRVQARDAVDVKSLADAPNSGAVSYIFHTGIGEGSRILDGEEEQLRCLIDPSTGMPL